jgi:hypothetical protein
MYDLACKMLKAILQSSPGEIDPGEWHLPFVEDTEYLTLEQSKRISAARCAGVSYETVDAEPMTIETDGSQAVR